MHFHWNSIKTISKITGNLKVNIRFFWSDIIILKTHYEVFRELPNSLLNDVKVYGQ